MIIEENDKAFIRQSSSVMKSFYNFEGPIFVERNKPSIGFDEARLQEYFRSLDNERGERPSWM